MNDSLVAVFVLVNIAALRHHCLFVQREREFHLKQTNYIEKHKVNQKTGQVKKRLPLFSFFSISQYKTK